MNERQRHQYLSAMGIDSFIPRVLLPHAPAPTLCDLPVVSETPAPPLSAPVQNNPMAPPAPSQVGNMLGDMGIATDKKPVRKEPLNLYLPQPKKGVTPVHLHLWRPSNKLLIIDEHTPGAALPTDRLLASILRACRQHNIPLGEPERMRCPLNEQLAKMYSQDDLREELQAWLSEELAKQQEPELWLMGPEAAQWFVSPENVPEAFSQTQLNLTGTQRQPAIVLPSLSKLLQEPQLKQKIWPTLNGV
ncbi:hypothetical protein [Gilvimarinus xylanilyticus]|uniref:Uncharacterized protein n=1 Tax=Gilvimarinus xylanilyticus TaxID=2944139 RepID=A0A9X2I5I6_9GAMM|nr:hypothetical protein [Gilvimarinus xylanilyticus]MCP8900306.1 hypothetical protein [Gilvimarinus xylanilyticus]